MGAHGAWVDTVYYKSPFFRELVAGTATTSFSLTFGGHNAEDPNISVRIFGRSPTNASVDQPTSWHAAQASASLMLWASSDEPEEPQPLRLLRHQSIGA
ncbi:hypothetical protein AK812_SmicGene15975 [Symbiodinium microadriaticum]|uniref:Uncharacterized protein n=1 Tax=Symbiodinium microadriaticum TaxID=2951 RepID=A0A1Q9E1K1_SYMMI|nr:hypothetical protein AK812_SmicGene15975 [Symbiodinium microadriaticum]